MVPKGWNVCTLDKVFQLGSGDTKPADISNERTSNTPFPVYGGNDVMGYSSSYNSTSEVVVIGRVGEKCGVTRLVTETCWITDNALYTKSFISETNKIFLTYRLQHQDLSRLRNKGSQPLVSQKPIYALEIAFPPIAEQTKIAQILSTWDKAIATTERLLANNQQQKQALLGPLLSGQKRFAGYPEWVNTPIAKLLTESRLPGSNGEVAKKITVKLYGNGVFAKDEKRIGSESTKYFTRKAGQFIYSKLDFLNGAFGIIPEHLDGYESTLDLPAFNFTEHVEPAWLVQYISREEFYSAQVGLANGGRKARRVNPADLLNIEIPLPPLPEQQKIAQVLSTADAEIANLQAQLAALKLEKKALMQQLLTGQRRVRLDDELEAPTRRLG